MPLAFAQIVAKIVASPLARRRFVFAFAILAGAAPACKEIEKTEPVQLKRYEKRKWPAPEVAALAPAVPAAKPIEYEKKLVFEDNFDRATFGEKWRVQGGDWRLDKGAVVTTAARNKCLWGTWELPADAEFEFDARSDHDAGDVKFSIYADGENYEGGYILIFGGWKNSVSLIARNDEHAIQKKLLDLVRQRSDIKVEKGRTYKFKVVRKGRLIEWFIDSAPFLTFDDARPLSGAGFNRFAFCNWESPLTFDNLKVYALVAKGQTAPVPR